MRCNCAMRNVEGKVHTIYSLPREIYDFDKKFIAGEPNPSEKLYKKQGIVKSNEFTRAAALFMYLLTSGPVNIREVATME